MQNLQIIYRIFTKIIVPILLLGGTVLMFAIIVKADGMSNEPIEYVFRPREEQIVYCTTDCHTNLETLTGDGFTLTCEVTRCNTSDGNQCKMVFSGISNCQVN
jgi:hypothetical protein